MIYFLLPKTNINMYQHLECIHSANGCPPTPVISNSLSYYLCDIKEKINDHEREWDIFKKYTNPYEYIHSIIPNKKKGVSKYKPLSRSYFKMIEIIDTFHILRTDDRETPVLSGSKIDTRLLSIFPKFSLDGLNALQNVSDSDIGANPVDIVSFTSKSNPIYKSYSKLLPPIQTFHLAEGPGGFIEAVTHLRKNPLDSYIGMTILDDKNDINIPAWKKSQQFLRENPNVFIENGADGTGNILNLENFSYCKEKYESSMDLITGDGGFDFSMDFNSQEIYIGKLLFAQSIFALCMQKKSGSFVLKIFDSFMQHTVDLIYLLSSFYEKVYMTKPQTSRYANSEKYIVCTNFLFDNCNSFYPYLYSTFQCMLSQTNTDLPLYRLLRIPISNHFLSKMEEFNSIFGQQQIENIHYTICLIETKNKADKIDILVKNNIQKCMKWCMKYQIPYNTFVNNTNIFLGQSSFFH